MISTNILPKKWGRRSVHTCHDMINFYFFIFIFIFTLFLFSFSFNLFIFLSSFLYFISCLLYHYFFLFFLLFFHSFFLDYFSFDYSLLLSLFSPFSPLFPFPVVPFFSQCFLKGFKNGRIDPRSLRNGGGANRLAGSRCKPPGMLYYNILCYYNMI